MTLTNSSSQMLSIDEVKAQVTRLKELASKASTEEELRIITAKIANLSRKYRVQNGIGIPSTPGTQARSIDPKYRTRPHLDYLSERIAEAVRDVERGQNRHIAISMPPRAGKSTLISYHTPLWLLRRHPEWKLITAAYDQSLTVSWARNIRRMIEDRPGLGIALKRDGGAGSTWDTEEGGGLFASSVRGTLTGRGARVLIIDDPIKDFVEAHSLNMRNSLWNWWLSVAQTRLEPPYLVMVVMTRWHEDDFIGRLFSEEYEGDARQWEKISIPAIAEDGDVLGRLPGAPLITPLYEEDEADAIERWDNVKRAVGSYTFSSMYQQRPAPQKGAIFDSSWWRFWTFDREKATEDGRVVYFDPSAHPKAKWCDSWDLNFESDDASRGGWVVGQRWLRVEGDRFLVMQQRGRWTFTQTLASIQKWTEGEARYNENVHDRLIEKRANGAAVIDTLKRKVSGIKPINPTTSKENRARAITPEIESGNVFIPHPSDPGNEWVNDFLSELRNFPHDSADDQVDSLSQALAYLRDEGGASITVPGGRQNRGGATWQVPRNLADAARTQGRRIYR